MKHLLFITLTLCLFSFSSCGDGWKWFDFGDDEVKLTGTKPEILIGKWECYGTGSFIFTTWKYYERYEIRKDGGLIVRQSYDEATQTYLDPTTYHFSNWLYSEEKELIYFNYTKTRSDRARSLREITPDSIKIAGSIYYKIKE